MCSNACSGGSLERAIDDQQASHEPSVRWRELEEEMYDSNSASLVDADKPTDSGWLLGDGTAMFAVAGNGRGEGIPVTVAAVEVFKDQVATLT